MDEDDNNVEDNNEMEANLYAQVYHDSIAITELPDIESNNNPSKNDVSKQSNDRYWQKSKSEIPPVDRRKFQKNRKTSFLPPPQASESVKPELNLPRCFTPYASVLSFLNPINETSEENNKGVSEKKNKHNKEKYFDRIAHKQLMKEKYAEKFKKSEKVRLKYAKKQLQDNSKTKAEEKIPSAIEISSSSEDEVVCIPQKPLTTINLDSSDDDVKLKRPMSPSTSSMISDDFIVNADRLRLSLGLANVDNQPIEGDKLLLALNQKIKFKNLKNLTKLSSSSSSASSTRNSSCERSPAIDKIKKLKSKRKEMVSVNTDEDTLYASKVKHLKKRKNSSLKVSTNENINNDDIERHVIAKTQSNRKRSNSKKSSDNNESESDKDEDPKLEMIARSFNKKKKVTVEETQNEVIIEDNSEKKDDVEIVENISEPIYEITDDSSVDSMKNFKTNLECELSLNVTQSPHVPHVFATPEEKIEKIDKTSIDCEIGWNDEMKYFYNECNYGRDFSLSSILLAMPNNLKYWQINHADRIRMNVDHDKRVRCRNCNELGHIAVNCKRPKKRIVCFMCGEEGHRETRCPNSICLRCGKPNRIFASTCSSCYNSNKKVCPLCHYKWHDIESCPDKWRRYHSTTSETDTIDTSFKRNSRVYCSICARSGHFAEQCSNFNKTIAGYITSSPINIVSNKSSYIKNYAFQEKKDSQQVLQLVSYLPCYKFNLKLPANCFLYPRFKEHFLNHQKKFLDKINALLSPSIKSNEVTKNQDNSEKTIAVLHHDDSNSNYSFTEFYNANSYENSSINQNAIDYIPLQNSNRNNEENIKPIVVDKITDAKIMLTKEHSSALMSPKAQDFLLDLGKKYNIISRFQWESTGNSLIIQGLSVDQENFHTEIRNFIYKFEIEELRIRHEKSSQAPRMRSQVINYLQSNLSLIRKVSVSETKKALYNLIGAEKELDYKKTIKYRKNLNIIFMGYSELLEGGQHVEALKRILVELKREGEQGNAENAIDQKLREEINKHMKYIFTAVDHGNYIKLFEDFVKAVRNVNNNSSNRQITRR